MNGLCAALIDFLDSTVLGKQICHSDSDARDLIEQGLTATTTLSRSGHAGAARRGGIDNVRDSTHGKTVLEPYNNRRIPRPPYRHHMLALLNSNPTVIDAAT